MTPLSITWADFLYGIYYDPQIAYLFTDGLSPS